MGEDETILCPYCATRFWFIPGPVGLPAQQAGAISYGADARDQIARADETALDAALSEGWPVSAT